MNEILPANYMEKQSAMLGASMARMPTLAERLEHAVNQAESQLADAKRARDILNANPALEELLNIMQKGRF